MRSNCALPSVSCLCVQIPCVLQIMELKGAKAESECKSKALLEELRATKEALHMRDASLQRNECDRQVILLNFSRPVCEVLQDTVCHREEYNT